MAVDNSIIIKKIKKGGHAAHGGAWKVAYADFVTAMMAFFLLLWLLNATEAEKLAGLADYFAPTVGVRGNMGIGFRGGKGALSKGIGADKSTNKGIIFAAPTQGTVVKSPEIVENENTLPEEEKIQVVQKEGTNEELQEIQESINKQFTESTDFEQFKKNISVETTPEGLKIQIMNSKDIAMFEEGKPEPTEDAKKILANVADIITLLPNYVSITGHTNSLPLGRGEEYTNWELSAERANAVRRFFIKNDVVKEQISQVVGKADNEPEDATNPEAYANNRIDVILLKDAYLTAHKKSAQDEVFVDPNSAKKENLISVDPTKKKEVAPKVTETPIPTTKGRDFFKGVTGDGLDYKTSEQSDIDSGALDVTNQNPADILNALPEEFFKNDPLGIDFYSDELSGGSSGELSPDKPSKKPEDIKSPNTENKDKIQEKESENRKRFFDSF